MTTYPRTTTLPRMIRFMAFFALTVGLIPIVFHRQLTTTNPFKRIVLDDVDYDDVVPENPLKQKHDTIHHAKEQQSVITATTTATTRTIKTVIDMQQQQQQDQSQNQHQHDQDYVLFYNVYLPVAIHDENNRTQNALRIIQEQLGQVRDSFAVTSRRITFLYFNTIGKENVLTEAYVQDNFCSSKGAGTGQEEGQRGKLECIHLHHYAKGFEEITLNDVYQWCLASSSSAAAVASHRPQQNQRIAVTYLHNKGSHHNRQGGSNDYWRWYMTDAVTSAHCITSTTTNNNNYNNKLLCQACGLLWQTIPSLHFPGNFWTARCDYIRQLLPPTAYDYGKKQTAMAEVLNNLTTTTNRHQQQSLLTANLYPNSSSDAAGAAEWKTGTSRYMWEQWIGSHPALQHVCDLSPTPDLDVWKTNEPKYNNNNNNKHNNKHLDFVLHKAPRRNLLDKHWQIKPRPNRTILMHSQLRKREMHLLPGLLWKWYLLYQTLPAPTTTTTTHDGDNNKEDPSWVYTHFPEGPDWKRRVEYILSLHDGSNNNNGIINSSLMDALFALATKEDETGAILTTKITSRTSTITNNNNNNNNTRATSMATVTMTKIPQNGDNAATTTNTTNWGTFVGGNNRSDDDDANVVVFYNIFIPPVNDTAKDEDNDAVVQNVLRIVREQLQQVRQSFAASSNATTNDKYTTGRRRRRRPPLTVFYTTIGRHNVLTDSVMAQLCGSHDDGDEQNNGTDTATTTTTTIDSTIPQLPLLDCRHNGHYDEGFEDLTLQKLYDFCQSNNNNNKEHNSVKRKSNSNDSSDDNMSVIYMHSKGTFHNWPGDSNERWRRHLTAAVTSRACLEPFQQELSSTCNVCGLQYVSFCFVSCILSEMMSHLLVISSLLHPL